MPYYEPSAIEVADDGTLVKRARRLDFRTNLTVTDPGGTSTEIDAAGGGGGSSGDDIYNTVFLLGGE